MARADFEESKLEKSGSESQSFQHLRKPVQCTEPSSTDGVNNFLNVKRICSEATLKKSIDHNLNVSKKEEMDLKKYILNKIHEITFKFVELFKTIRSKFIQFHDSIRAINKPICYKEPIETADNGQTCDNFNHLARRPDQRTNRSLHWTILFNFTFICFSINLLSTCSASVEMDFLNFLLIRKTFFLYIKWLTFFLFYPYLKHNLCFAKKTHTMFKQKVTLCHVEIFKSRAIFFNLGCPRKIWTCFNFAENFMLINSLFENIAMDCKQRNRFHTSNRTKHHSRRKERYPIAVVACRAKKQSPLESIIGKLAFLLEIKRYYASLSYGFQALFILHSLLTSLMNVMSLVNLRNSIRRHQIVLSIVYVISNDNSMKNKEKSVRCYKKNKNFTMISLIGPEETMRVKSKRSSIEILLSKDLFDFRKVPFSNEIITVFPIYGDMSNEMHRLGTLSTFPTSSCPSLIRLARSGFYYKGNGTELVCFSCNVRYDKWTFSSIPDNIHFDISPQCEHLKLICSENNMSKLNVSSELPRPKHDTVSQGANSATGSVIESDHNPQTTTSVPQLLITASHNPVSWKGYDSGYSSYSSKGSRRLGLNSSLATSASRDSGIYSSSGSSGDSGLGKSGLSGGLSSGNSGLASTSGLPSGMTRGAHSNPAPRNVPTEKYPEFKPIEKRRASYEDWPSNLQFLHPLDLAECGFFYSKFGDCVRCFHCGIGLRNWESDDNPWVEHARWSKNCHYLIQKKGQEFIDSVLKIIGLQTDAEIERQKSGASNESEKEYKAATSDPIKHPAARYVIKEKIFGDIQEKTVKRAMNQLLQDQDWDNITNDTLVNILLEKKDQWENPEPKPSTCDTSKAQASASGTSGNSQAISEDPEAIQKENETLKDLYTCKICFDEKVGITFVPCGHLVTCKNCSPKIRKCPLCRTFIRGTIKTTI